MLAAFLTLLREFYPLRNDRLPNRTIWPRRIVSREYRKAEQRDDQSQHSHSLSPNGRTLLDATTIAGSGKATCNFLCHVKGLFGANEKSARGRLNMWVLTIGGAALAALTFVVGANAQSRNSGYGSQPYGTGSNSNSNSVEGYTNKNGTYVQPYERTNPNSSKTDNYNAPGNFNPNPPRR